MCFGIEGRMPAAPGKYDLSLTLTNLATKQSFLQTQSVLVPGFGDRFGVSQLFFADSLPPARSQSPSDPFSFSGVRLRPIGSENASVTQGTPLRAIFQVWAPADSPLFVQGQKLKIHYLIGKLNSTQRIEEDQEVDRGSFNEEGDLLMGKDLATDALAPGVYRLVVKITDMKSAASAYQSLNFEVRDKAQPVAALWTVDIPGTQLESWRRFLQSSPTSSVSLASINCLWKFGRPFSTDVRIVRDFDRKPPPTRSGAFGDPESPTTLQLLSIQSPAALHAERTLFIC